MGFWALLEAVDELKPAVPRFHVQGFGTEKGDEYVPGFLQRTFGDVRAN